MKKVLLSVAGILMLAAIMAGCKGNSPKATAEQFLNGFYHLDYASAKQVADSDTRKLLDSWEQLLGTMINKSAKDEARKTKVTIKEPVVTGDNATVEYMTDKDPTPRTLRMVKQKGQWLAQMSKMDMGGGMSGGGTGPSGDPNGGTNNGGMSTPDTLMAPPADGTMNNTDNGTNGTGTTPDATNNNANGGTAPNR